jgi:hypothetical protein
MMITTPGRNADRDRSSCPPLHALHHTVVSHDDVMGHGLDDVVQWFMFPVGNRATGIVQSHVDWFGMKHACHLHVGGTPIGNRHVALAGLGRGRQIRRNIAQIRLAHGRVLAFGKAVHSRRWI